MKFITPKDDYMHVGRPDMAVVAGKVHVAFDATNQPDWREHRKVFCNGLVLVAGEYVDEPLTIPDARNAIVSAIATARCIVDMLPSEVENVPDYDEAFEALSIALSNAESATKDLLASLLAKANE